MDHWCCLWRFFSSVWIVCPWRDSECFSIGTRWKRLQVRRACLFESVWYKSPQKYPRTSRNTLSCGWPQTSREFCELNPNLPETGYRSWYISIQQSRWSFYESSLINSTSNNDQKLKGHGAKKILKVWLRLWISNGGSVWDWNVWQDLWSFPLALEILTESQELV